MGEGGWCDGDAFCCRINGPFAAFTSYVSEFHSARYRARIMIMRGLIVHSANLVMPLLAWAVFPLELEIKLFDNQIGESYQTKLPRDIVKCCSVALLERLPLHFRTSELILRCGLYLYARNSKVFDDQRTKRKGDGSV